ESFAAVALAEPRVLAGAEIVEDLVVREAAAIVANVKYDAFLIVGFGVKRAEKAIQARLFHVGNMDVAESAVAEFGNRLGVTGDPALVHQIGSIHLTRPHGAAADALHFDFPRGLRIGRIAGDLQAD